METEATEWAPIPDDLPLLDDETLADRELQGGEETDVRLAILRVGRGRRHELRRKVAESRGLLRSYLGRTRG